MKKAKEKIVHEIKKGVFSIDGYNSIMQSLTDVSHKPTEEDLKKYDLRPDQIGDRSDYDIFDKKVKITIEIFD